MSSSCLRSAVDSSDGPGALLLIFESTFLNSVRVSLGGVFSGCCTCCVRRISRTHGLQFLILSNCLALSSSCVGMSLWCAVSLKISLKYLSTSSLVCFCKVERVWCPEGLRIHVLAMLTAVRIFALHLFAIKRCMFVLTPFLWIASRWRCARASSSFLFDALMDCSSLWRSCVRSLMRASTSSCVHGCVSWGCSRLIKFFTCFGMSVFIFA